MPLPDPTVEVEFVDPTWTDLTDPITGNDVDMGAGIEVSVGRTSAFSQPGPSTMTFALRNPKGKYTPGVAVLSDGSAAPYYPNVIQRRRSRYSTPDGVRFLGYTNGWKPDTNGFEGSSRCVVSSIDRLGPLSKVNLDTPLRYESLVDEPLLYWPLTDPADSTSAAEQSGNNGPILRVIRHVGNNPLVFGDDGAGVGNGTGVRFDPADTDAGQYLAGQSTVNVDMSTYSVNVWVRVPVDLPSWINPESGIIFQAIDPLGRAICIIRISGTGQPAFSDNAVSMTATRAINDNRWHLLTVTRETAGGQVRLYVDGVFKKTSLTSTTYSNGRAFTLGASIDPQRRFLGNVSHVAVYGTQLLSARLRELVIASKGYPGDRTDQRIARWLVMAGVDPADYTLDEGKAVVGSYPQDGKDLVSACQDMATTEGGGAVFYVLAGQIVFRNRDFRLPADPVLTIAAGEDDAAASYQPSLDDQNLANVSTASRSAESGTVNQLTARDATSIALNGETPQDVTTYTTSDLDALNLAQWIVAAGRTPGFRLPQLTVDLLTAENDLVAAVQAVEIGSRVRITNLPTAQAPSSIIDGYVEGWRERCSTTEWSVTFDISPADNPADGIWSDDVYGRWGTDGQSLDGAISSSDTTLVIATEVADPVLPTFTTDPDMYPLDIVIDAEVISLTDVPDGATSPQTFTGCLRAQAGTTAAAHADASPIDLWPTPTWGL